MLTRLARRLVGFSYRRRWPFLAASLLLVGLSLWATTGLLQVNTDTDALFDSDLPFRITERAHDKLFPADQDLISAVIDGPSQAQAEEAANRLADKLRSRTDLFRSVRNPESGFSRNAFLYLSQQDLGDLANNLANAQPMLATVATDRSARGLFRLLALAFDAAADGNPAAAGLAPAASQAAAAVTAAMAGKSKPIDWGSLFAGLSPSQQPRAFVLAQPVLDTEQLEEAGAGTAEIRATARQLGLTPDAGYRVRLTGEQPLADEEFATVAEGTWVSGIAAAILVGGLLYLALGSVRLVVAAVLLLGVGLIYTLGWAAVAVGELNVISIAFAVMFVGIAVDFAIQFLVRYRVEGHGGTPGSVALERTGSAMARPLLLAAMATALGFFSFLPTAYRGVAQLGLIAGGGILIALLLCFTLLPALLRVLKPREEPTSEGIPAALPINLWILRHRRTVLAVGAIAGLLACTALPRLTFDFDPLKLKDPKSESMATLNELNADPLFSQNTLDVLAPTAEDAKAMADKLSALPEVRQALTISDMIPDDQEAKLATIDDLSLMLGPALAPAPSGPAPSHEEILAAANVVRAHAQAFLAKPSTPELEPLRTAARDLAAALDKLLAQGDSAAIESLSANLVGNLDEALRTLGDAMQAQRVTIDNLPDDLRQSWIATDGRYRVQVFPKIEGNEVDALKRFVAAIRRVAPDAEGPPTEIVDRGRVVINAFAVAAISALASITLLLFAILRRLRDVVCVLAPLLFAALLTLGTCAIMGLSLNFANIIGLPLLLGVGVTFPIYFVTAWRGGERHLLAAPAGRAMVFSALTTGGAFGSLALSHHPGTASLGVLLALALGYTLLSTLIVLPALLGEPRPAAA